MGFLFIGYAQDATNPFPVQTHGRKQTCGFGLRAFKFWFGRLFADKPESLCFPNNNLISLPANAKIIHCLLLVTIYYIFSPFPFSQKWYIIRDTEQKPY